MTDAHGQPEPIDRPFPGAHSQVRGTRGEPATAEPNRVRLEATQTRTERGWMCRLPVRAEHVNISKRVVVRERVLVGRRTVEDVARVDADVKREVLRVDSDRTRTGELPPEKGEHL